MKQMGPEDVVFIKFSHASAYRARGFNYSIRQNRLTQIAAIC